MAAPRSSTGDAPGKAWVRARLRDLGDAGRLGRCTGAVPLTVRLSAGPPFAGERDPPEPTGSAPAGIAAPVPGPAVPDAVAETGSGPLPGPHAGEAPAADT